MKTPLSEHLNCECYGPDTYNKVSKVLLWIAAIALLVLFAIG